MLYSLWIDQIDNSHRFHTSESSLTDCFTFSGYVIYYNMVPEGEKHDSALKRNKEALTAEVKLWEGYLQKVNLMTMKH